MNTTTKETAITTLNTLAPFIGPHQRACLRDLCDARHEEHQFFRDMIRDLKTRIDTMPKTYEQDGLGENAIVSLHYFWGGCDWYITEKDSDPDGLGQVQAFGFANLNDPQNAEWGYISLPELLGSGVELDLYWTPTPFSNIKKARE